jgi:hypothetical protein
LNSTFNCVIFFWRNSILRREGMKMVNTFRRRVTIIELLLTIYLGSAENSFCLIL